MPPEQAEADAPTSLRDRLEANFAADAAAAPPEAVTPEPAQAVAPAGDPTTATPKDLARAEPVRDESGRFAPKADAAPVASAAPAPSPVETKITDQPAVAGAEPPQEAIRPPSSWSAPAKAKFATLDPDVQSEIAKRERDVDKALAERAGQLKRFEPLEAVIAPVRAKLAAAGVSPEQYFGNLSAADEALSGPNKVQALAQIAQQYGIDLRQFGQPTQSGEQPQQRAQPDPAVAALAEKVASMEQSHAQQLASAQQAEQAQTSAQIAAFAKDHLYFDNVKGAMRGLIESGEAATLDEAYDMACWARPDIRPLLMREQQDKRDAEARAEASAKAAEARQASGSVTGSPAPGTVPVQNGPTPTLRERLEQQFSAA